MPRKATGKQVRDTDGTVRSIHGKLANETGSVYQAKADGSWRATWRDTSEAKTALVRRAGIDPTGIATHAASDRFPALLAHPAALADPYV